jgi:hypothetical protein
LASSYSLPRMIHLDLLRLFHLLSMGKTYSQFCFCPCLRRRSASLRMNLIRFAWPNPTSQTAPLTVLDNCNIYQCLPGHTP